MSGHGWVTPNADGSVARCGGPGLCRQCSVEAVVDSRTNSNTYKDLLIRLLDLTWETPYKHQNRVRVGKGPEFTKLINAVRALLKEKS